MGNDLHTAAANHDWKSARKLLKREEVVGINALDKEGYSPLHYAAESGETELVMKMIQKGALVDLQSNTKEGHKCSAIHLASQKGHTTTVKELIRAGSSVNLRDSIGRTPLFFAAAEAQSSVIELLFENNAQVNVQDINKQTALHVVAEYGHPGILKQLLHHKDINVQMMNKNGETPLDIALDKNHSEIIDLLCKFQSTQKQPIVFETPAKRALFDILTDIVIQDKLGAGNFSEVFLGTWQGTPVALKSVSNVMELLKEIDVLKSINHPNIVRYFGIYEHLDKAYMVMEYLALGSLNSYLQREQKNLATVDLIGICKQVAAAMKHLEQKRVIHRDLAARNVLVAPGDGIHKVTVKVGDFGLSRILEKKYYMSNFGTIPYKWSAPEALMFRAYSNRSDVWSFGILMWEVFSFGQMPFSTIDNSELTEALAKGVRPEQPEGCPTEVYELMQQCWQEHDSRPSFLVLSERLAELWEKSRVNNVLSEVSLQVQVDADVYFTWQRDSK